MQSLAIQFEIRRLLQSSPKRSKPPWNNGGVGMSVRHLGHMMLESGLRFADRPALWVDGTIYQYADLLDHAARIAAALAAQTPVRRCAVFGTRSVWAYAGVVGALLADAAYVPLNLRHPPDRLLHVLAAAKVDAILLDARSMEHGRHLLSRLPYQVTVLIMDADIPDWAISEPRHTYLGQTVIGRLAPAVRAKWQEPAYLLFTSGSTGVPKGVLVGQANVAHYLDTVAKRYQLTPDDRCTQLFDLTFDLSVHDLFATWQAGATLYCPPETVLRAPSAFVKRHELTCWFSVPATIASMAQLHQLRPEAFPTLRWSLFCGEALPRALAEHWAAAAPNSQIDNLYGPTEATIAVTGYRLPRPMTDLPDILPIGAPFPEHRAVIVGEDGRQVANGEAGELYLCGPQVSLGYWEQPEMTAERFAPPLGVWMGRWYRTGDRVRHTSLGLQFLGRIDRQVKISGYRIELQEVEIALRRLAGDVSAAVLVWPVDANGLARGLTGFVADHGHPSDEILASCRRELPPYMVPQEIHRVTEWPLNSNGKTDYVQLRRML